MKVLYALLIALVGGALVFAEVKIFKALKRRMEKDSVTLYNPQYSGYIILGTVSVTVVMILWAIKYFN